MLLWHCKKDKLLMETHVQEQNNLAIREKAKAKINLTLHVKGKRDDGYHELESLVVFASTGDDVVYYPDRLGDLRITGPFAIAIDGENLIDKARRAISEWLSHSFNGQFELTKSIPVAAGLGGGSSDAAAAIRALFKAANQPIKVEELYNMASRIGADIPVCLKQETAWMCGIGERIRHVDNLGSLPALLVNPGVKLSTRDVFMRLSAKTYNQMEEAFPQSPEWTTPYQAVDWLKQGRNDLEKPAVEQEPMIKQVLDQLITLDGCLLSRLSGSGPTCFGIFNNDDDRDAAAETLKTRHPKWWISATQFG